MLLVAALGVLISMWAASSTNTSLQGNVFLATDFDRPVYSFGADGTHAQIENPPVCSETGQSWSIKKSAMRTFGKGKAMQENFYKIEERADFFAVTRLLCR